MAEALILDSEAVNALASRSRRAVLADRARAILTVAHERRALVRVPAPVLAELHRAPRFDAPLDLLLASRGIVVCELTQAVARRAGHLLGKAKLSSAHAVDAFVVSTALLFDTAMIATGDADDIGRLASGYRQIRIFRI